MARATDPKSILTSQERCPRCDGRHENFRFKKLRKIERDPRADRFDKNYWALCPKTREPFFERFSDSSGKIHRK
jgi:hypothetical protein